MNNILENIATRIGEAHLIVNQNALTRENCRADLTGLPIDRVVVDMDVVFPSGQRGQKQCDYVIFFLNTSEDTCFAVPIELKRGTVKTVISPETFHRFFTADGFIAGHSLRVGSAVSLAQAGATVVDMQIAGRWKSSQMPAHYAKAELAERGAIARFKDGKRLPLL